MPDKESPQPPRKIRVNHVVRGDWPIGHIYSVGPGIYEAAVNPQGAVSAKCADGTLLGLKPDEFEWVAAEESPSALPREICGTWPKDCVQRAFVEGAKWWQFSHNGSTMFPSERDLAESEAVKRYGDPEKEESPSAPLCEKCGESMSWRDTGFWRCWPCDMESPSAPQPRDWRTMCIVEIAAENPSVSDYVRHWEGRTLSAEARVQALEEALTLAKVTFFDNDGGLCMECGETLGLKPEICPTCKSFAKIEELLTPKPANEAPETK